MYIFFLKLRKKLKRLKKKGKNGKFFSKKWKIFYKKIEKFNLLNISWKKILIKSCNSFFILAWIWWDFFLRFIFIVLRVLFIWIEIID